MSCIRRGNLRCCLSHVELLKLLFGIHVGCKAMAMTYEPTNSHHGLSINTPCSLISEPLVMSAMMLLQQPQAGVVEGCVVLLFSFEQFVAHSSFAVSDLWDTLVSSLRPIRNMRSVPMGSLRVDGLHKHTVTTAIHALCCTCSLIRMTH